MKNVVTTDYTMKYEGGYSGVEVLKETVTGSQGFNCNGKPCYFGNLTVTIPSGCCSSEGYVNINPIVIIIKPSSVNLKSRGMGVILDGDSGKTEVILVNTEYSPQTYSILLKAIINANQSRVKAS